MAVESVCLLANLLGDVMLYTLTVTKFRENPSYAEQQTEYDRKRQYGNTFDLPNAPLPLLQDRELTVTLTEAEYQAVKKAVLEQFA